MGITKKKIIKNRYNKFNDKYFMNQYGGKKTKKIKKKKKKKEKKVKEEKDKKEKKKEQEKKGKDDEEKSKEKYEKKEKGNKERRERKSSQKEGKEGKRMGSTEKKERQREKQLKREEKKLEIFKQKYEEVFSKPNKFKGWSDNAKNKVKTKTLELCEGSELDEQFKKIETKLVKKITKAKSMKKPLYESQMKQKKIQFCTKHMSLLGSFSGLLTTMINICRYTEKTSGIKDAKLTGKKKTTKNKKTQKKKAKFTAKADILKKIYIESLVKQYEDIKGKAKTKKAASGDIGEYENIPERLKNILTIVYKQTAAAPAKGTAAPAKGKGDKGKDAKAGKGAAPAKGKGEKGKGTAAPAKGKGSNIEEKMKTMTIENINCQKVKLSKEDLKILKLNKKLVTGERNFYGKKKSGTAKLERKSEYKKANQKYKKDKGKSPKAP